MFGDMKLSNFKQQKYLTVSLNGHNKKLKCYWILRSSHPRTEKGNSPSVKPAVGSKVRLFLFETHRDKPSEPFRCKTVFCIRKKKIGA